jgi:hypothetical protein
MSATAPQEITGGQLRPNLNNNTTHEGGLKLASIIKNAVKIVTHKCTVSQISK